MGVQRVIEEDDSLSHLCIYMVDAKSLILEYNTRTVFIVGSVEIALVQCET